MDKGPFPKPTTDVQFQVLQRNDDTGEVTLKIMPVHGDIVYYDIGSDATSGSNRVEDLHAFKTSEIEVSFLCVDSTKQHDTGGPRIWKNKVTLKKKVYGDNNEKHVELKSAPPGAVIRYTTDGSNPRTNGGIYSGSFAVKKGTRMVLVIAEKNSIYSEPLQVDINWNGKLDIPTFEGPAIWKHEHKQMTTKESFELITRLNKYEGKLLGPRIRVVGDNWLELNADEKVSLSADQVEALINALRDIYSNGQVNVDALSLLFPSRQHLTDFAADEKKEVNYDEVMRG